MNEAVDGRGPCLSSGALRNSHLDRIQPVRDQPTREKGEGAGGGVENTNIALQVWLLPVKERGKGGGMGRKSLRVQLSSEKASTNPRGVLEPESLLRGVPHLARRCLPYHSCNVQLGAGGSRWEVGLPAAFSQSHS